MTARTVVLVHGAFHGPWCWERVTPLLDDAGVRWCAPELPLRDLHSDADVVRDALDRIAAAGGGGAGGDDGGVVLVGHSYGGAVVTDAGDHPAVARVVYLAAIAPDADEALGTAGGPDAEAHWQGPDSLASAVAPGDGGTLVLQSDAVGPHLYGDCDDATIAWATSHLRPQSALVFGQSPRRVAWRTKPSTYVVCTRDRAVPPAVQRLLAARCDDVVEWSSAHSPFASMPRETADLLIDLSR